MITEYAHNATQKKNLDALKYKEAKYIDIRESGCLKNNTYRANMEEYITYRKDVDEKSNDSFPRCLAINIINHDKHKHVWHIFEDTALDDDLEIPLCEIACDQPIELWNYYKDVILGDFVLVRPLDTNIDGRY